jgi:23S rRNA-/tRNA-specific pseudouridylate synthase
MTARGRRVLVVDAEGAGERLDRWVAGALDLSRTRVADLVEEGHVTWNGERPRKSEPLAEGDRIEVELPAPQLPRAEPEDIPLDVVHEDAHLLVVNKPAGMVVHPAPGHPTGDPGERPPPPREGPLGDRGGAPSRDRAPAGPGHLGAPGGGEG